MATPSTPSTSTPPANPTPAEEPKHLLTAANALTFATALLTSASVPPPHATLIAQCLLAADLRGIDTHGISRLPSYLARVRAGALSATATPTFASITPCVGQVDGHNAFGFLAAHLGMEKAIEMAQIYGIGMVSVKHSNHFGMSAWIVRQALDAGMMSLVFTNSSPALPAWGGREKLLGVSPIACGAPAGGRGGARDFVLDMAPSVAARGKIYKARRRGEKIPLDWALDGEGRRTDDPNKALERGAVMLPMGGPKGSGLAVMMDVFSGVLSGSAFAGGVVGPYDLEGGEADAGHFLVAIKPDLFVSLEEFRERMDVLYHRVVGSERMEGVERIYFPGEIEQLEQERREREGIPLVQAEVDALNEEARRWGSEELKLGVGEVDS